MIDLTNWAFNPSHIHKNHETEYELLLISNSTATKPGWIDTAVYINEDLELYSCPMWEFEGKMDIC